MRPVSEKFGVARVKLAFIYNEADGYDTLLPDDYKRRLSLGRRKYQRFT